MSLLKSSQRRATTAWSTIKTSPDLIAAGTVAGTIGLDFDTSAQLEIFQLDLKSPDNQMKVLGKTTSSNRFHKIAWGNMVTSNFPYGIIGGGMDSGAVSIWNPATIISGETDPNITLLGTHQKHNGPVQAIDFNPFQANLLASGASDNEIFIWEISNPAAPTVYSPGQKPPGGAETTCVAWNKKVQHILASSTYSGTATIWDLKAKRAVITFSDRKKPSRCRAMAWNPQEATQVLTASEDDDYPVLQLWDLRNIYAPIKYFEGHTAGIWGVSWCPSDNSLVLSCGKDNRTLCWHVESGQVLCDVESNHDATTTSSWNTDVQWSPRLPSVLSTTSLEGKINVYALQDVCERNISLSDLGVAAQPAASSRSTIKHTPNWLVRPVGATFGFGGNIAMFSKTSEAAAAAPAAVKPDGTPAAATATPTANHSSIKIRRIETERDFLSKSEQLDHVISSHQFEAFCQEKISQATSEDDKQTWAFLKVLFNKGGRHQILSYLGYDEETTRAQLERFASTLPELKVDHQSVVDSPLVASQPSPSVFSVQQQSALEDETSTLSLDDGENKGSAESTAAAAAAAAAVPNQQQDVAGLFGADQGGFDFSSIPPPVAPVAVVEPTQVSSSAPVAAPKKKLGSPITFFSKNEADDNITRALLVGNFALAVDCCLRLGRDADALVLAACGGPELFAKTQESYFRSHPQSFANVVGPIVRGDLADLIERVSLAENDWKAALAVLCTYCKSSEFSDLSGRLAARLEASGDEQAATLVYICAGNLDRTIERWAHSSSIAKSSRSIGKHQPESRHLELQDFVEKVSIFRAALHARGELSEIVAARYIEYAEILANQGRIPMALHYLSFLNDPKYHGTKGAALFDRVYNSQVQALPDVAPPPFPFQRVEVGVLPQQQQQLQQQKQPVQQQFQPGSAVHPSPSPTSSSAQPVPFQPSWQPQPPPGTYGGAPPPSSYPQYGGGMNATPVHLPNQPATGYSVAPPPTTFQPVQPKPAPPPSSSQYGGAPAPPPVGHPQSNYAHPPPTSTGFTPAPPAGNTNPPTGYYQPPPTANAPVVSTPPPTSNPVPAPAVSAPPPASAPVAAPPPVASAPAAASSSSAPADASFVISSLNRVLEITRGPSQARPADKQKWEDTNKRLAQLNAKLSNGEIPAPAVSSLQAMCQSLNAGNIQEAMDQQYTIVQTYSTQLGSTVVPALKRVIEMSKLAS